MAATNRRTVDLGDLLNPASPRFQIGRIRNELIRTTIEGYLENVGVEIDRSDPPGWFQWLVSRTVFHTRCADPPEPSAPDDGWQPFNYFIRVRLSDNILRKRAVGEDFYHESSLAAPD